MSAEEILLVENRRPARVTDLIYQGGTHEGLWGASARKPRYYVVNLRTVIGRLGIVPANMRAFFDEYGPKIAEETAWADQVPAKFGCNYTHISSTKAIAPKYFEHAATIIFVLEKYAEKFKPTVNVYDHLRIIPAHYFIDDFDKNMFDELTAYYAGLSEEERGERFGEDAPDKFEAVCLRALNQPQRSKLIKQMAWGFCVTRFIADQLRLFINSKFPSQFNVGLVLSSGQNANLPSAGSKAAAADLIVPQNRRPDELTPIPLAKEPTELDGSLLKDVAPTDPIPVSDSIVGVEWAPRLRESTKADGQSKI